MNLNPNQPDETIDQALLEEALSEPMPAELQAKILELTDPHMLSLLDEVLAPEQPSDALKQRILATTPGQAQHLDAPSVIARISPATFRYAAAAAIALAVGLGVYFVTQSPVDTQNTIAGKDPLPDIPGAVADNTAFDWPTQEQYASEDSIFDSATSNLELTLEDAFNSLDEDTITRETMWVELDAYVQFLDEVES